MLYTLNILTCTDETRADPGAQRGTWHHYQSRNLAKIWRIAERHARRGVKLYGGKVERMPWGMRGGVFPDSYRAATIRVEVAS